jgi:hypothetical protein
MYAEVIHMDKELLNFRGNYKSRLVSFRLKIMQKPLDSLIYYCYDFLQPRKEDNRMNLTSIEM